MIWYWGPVALFMGVVFVGSSFSHLPQIPGGFSDKVAHACEYAVLAALVARGLAGARWLAVTWRPAAAAAILATLYGVSDEFHQLLVPGREFDVHDMLADGTGASAAAGILWLCGIIRRFCGLSLTSNLQQPPTSNHDVREPSA